MKIGYPCINLTIDCKGDRTFRLKSYSKERLIKTVENNLSCLIKMLNFNIDNNILFFRITSDLIPFASHPVCKFNWHDYFKNKLQEIGLLIKKNNIRISMHPDQFIVLNSKNTNVVKNSIAELTYHSDILDIMRLDKTAKIQLHIGGGYGNKNESLQRFIKNFKNLNKNIRKRIVIENDDRIFSFDDCLFVTKKIRIPILFDVLHHNILNNSERINEILDKQSKTWAKEDGVPMVDYSSQKIGFRPGSHAETINIRDFETFLKESYPYDLDIMLEIKDKESSALKAIEIVKKDIRFVNTS
jgi:UV DNA damage endonuclease